MTLPSSAMFQPLQGIYEPSAIQQLPDGRFLVVEDEKQQPFSLVTIHPDGSVNSAPLRPAVREAGEAFWRLNDLEGVAIDRSGNIYAITSHSRDSKGDEKKSRNQLVRFRIEGDHVVDLQVVMELKPALLEAHPVLAAASEIPDVKTDGGLNIEALEFGMDSQHLLIGFRSPLLDHHAIIASLENPAAVVEDDAPPRISSTLITLNLDGMGIRGMAFMPSLGGHLVIAGPVAREQAQFHLWFWSGRPGEPPRRMTVAGLHGFEHAEGVCAAILDGHQRIVIVSDDGSRNDGRFARFLLLDPGQLQMES